MALKSLAAKIIAPLVAERLQKEDLHAIDHQQIVFNELLKSAQRTEFGVAHDFQSIHSFKDFAAKVPIRDYEALKTFINQIKDGKSNVLWPGKPTYFAKTSGTTSGVKYIPITKESIPNHIGSARDMLFNYIHASGKAAFTQGKMIFLSGNPVLDTSSFIPTGRLSGIVNHHVPAYLTANRLPSYQTNCIEDWELKLEKIVEETIGQNMTLISGIPPWVQMYFDRLTAISGKSIKELFPNLGLMIHGGVNFKPYKLKLLSSLGGHVDMLETFPASEGFFAWEDPKTEGLRLNVNSGIFFEFVPVSEFNHASPTRLNLADVQLRENYVMLVSTNAGLWAYNVGDTVKFVSINPPRIQVTGRLKHFISAFGEHVIGQEVSNALAETCKKFQVETIEFTVAPQVNPQEGLPYHEWLIAFQHIPEQPDAFAIELDSALCRQNIYYRDLIQGKILQRLKITLIQPQGFQLYMKSEGKLGGQNKVPSLSNNRLIADGLQSFILK